MKVERVGSVKGSYSSGRLIAMAIEGLNCEGSGEEMKMMEGSCMRCLSAGLREAACLVASPVAAYSRSCYSFSIELLCRIRVAFAKVGVRC